MNLEWLLPTLLIVGLFTLLTTPYVIRRLLQAGITGVDVHKRDKPVRAEMGGFVCLMAIALAMLVLTLLRVDSLVLLALLTLTLVGLVGVADDLIGLRQRYKPFLVAAATAPLAWSLSGRESMIIPGAGTLAFGLLYPLILIPLGIATASNLTNMYAGFNGLEVGLGTIGLLSITLLSGYKESWSAFYVGGTLLATLIPFLRYNWYPARVFPGDAGTLLIGAGIATVSVMSGLEFAGIICLVPAGIDFTLKIMSRRPFRQRSAFGDTTVRDDGSLTPPPYPALAHAFMRTSTLTEPNLVLSLLTMQTIYSVIAFLVGLTFL